MEGGGPMVGGKPTVGAGPTGVPGPPGVAYQRKRGWKWPTEMDRMRCTGGSKKVNRRGLAHTGGMEGPDPGISPEGRKGPPPGDPHPPLPRDRSRARLLFILLEPE